MFRRTDKTRLVDYCFIQKKRFSDSMKLILQCCHIPSEKLEALASDRQIWRDTCDSGLATYFAEYASAAENRRVRRHQPATVTFSGYRCPDCNRSCAPAVGLYSYRRTNIDCNICSGASSSNIDGIPQASKKTAFYTVVTVVNMPVFSISRPL